LFAVPLEYRETQVEDEDVAAVERSRREGHFDHTYVLDSAADVQQARLVRSGLVVLEAGVVTCERAR
jgi:hypothetical protein